MANAAALNSLAASYAKRFGRATPSTLRALARQYGGAAKDYCSGATAPAGDAHAGPIIMHLLGRIAALKGEVIDALTQPAAVPAAACTAAGVAPGSGESPVDIASAWQSERGDMPLFDWIRRKARKDMLTMSEQDLSKHLHDLDRIRQAPWGAVAAPESTERARLVLESEYRRLRNELEAALHIGWLLQEEFPGAGAHADTEAMLLERMTPYESAQYEVRKENARRRQEFRRRKPGVFTPVAAGSRKDSPAATPGPALERPRA